MTTYTITGALEALRSGHISSVDLVEQGICVADRLDETTGMYVTRYDTSALVAATEADTLRLAGSELGPLHGIPIAIKDIITTREGHTTAQSAVHDREALFGDAAVVARLRAAGAIIVGKLSLAEFAVGAPDQWAGFRSLRNPWDLGYSPGGSSAGAGIAVASGAVLAALGTDTGGSIRIPAAFNGCSGLMPTYGRVPKSGCVPLAYSLDRIGPMARSAADCALLLSVLAGHDSSDTSAIDVPVDDYCGALTGDLSGVKIGIDRLNRFSAEREDPAMAAAFDAAVRALQARGAEIIEITLPFYEEMSVATWITMLSEAASYHMPDLQTQLEKFGSMTRATILRGLFYSASDYVQAQRARTVGVRALRELYESVDLVVTPTVAGPAQPVEDLVGPLDEAEMFSTVFTAYWNATGNPVVSVPMGVGANGLPLSLQIAGRPFEDALVLRAGDAYQQDTQWHLRVPPLASSSIVAQTGSNN